MACLPLAYLPLVGLLRPCCPSGGTMDDFSLKCFGVGDGTPSAERNHSAYLYRLGTATLLIDCGEPVSRSFKATGLSYETIDRIFLSHLHSDHVGGLFMLLQGFWLEQRRQQLTIHL